MLLISTYLFLNLAFYNIYVKCESASVVSDCRSENGQECSRIQIWENSSQISLHVNKTGTVIDYVTVKLV